MDDLTTDFVFSIGLLEMIFEEHPKIASLKSKIEKKCWEQATVTKLLSSIKSDLLSYLFEETVRSSESAHYWRYFYTQKKPDVKISYTPDEQVALYAMNLENGLLTLNIYQNEDEIFWDIKIHGYAYFKNKYIVLHLVNFIDGDLMARIPIYFDDAVRLDMLVTEFELLTTHTPLMTNAILKISKKAYQRHFGDLSKIAFNLTLKSIYAKGIETSIWSLTETSNEGHNLEKLTI